MGNLCAKDHVSDSEIVYHATIINSETHLLSNDTGIRYNNVIHFDSDDYVIESDDDVLIIKKPYTVHTINELFNELENTNDQHQISDILSLIGTKLEGIDMLDLNKIWDTHHMLIFNKIKNNPQICIDLKLHLLQKETRIPLIKIFGKILYETYPNDALIILNHTIEKVITIKKRKSKRYADLIPVENIRNQIIQNDAVTALSNSKYGMAYIMFKKIGCYNQAENVLQNYAPQYVKLLIY
ncbi:hypothetical protein QKU48_gp1374 [Fadolivirus algeromassiliense]|jgi:hypothetical protein|uniref:Uncharacterized protein n=1 Tax=Fadolivirus FV1/VV64 TaxID=3070911 RepID=A0A7D3V635_9VIRU|nr:hypothetical protein QKU48_gp1374 [Fadolivirus algeromassiliense]QKF94832.1 hypothetical protein Fadolivirus_1_1374 [Fadolivirus FV1/VV64]